MKNFKVYVLSALLGIGTQVYGIGGMRQLYAFFPRIQEITSRFHQIPFFKNYRVRDIETRREATSQEYQEYAKSMARCLSIERVLPAAATYKINSKSLLHRLFFGTSKIDKIYNASIESIFLATLKEKITNSQEITDFDKGKLGEYFRAEFKRIADDFDELGLVQQHINGEPLTVIVSYKTSHFWLAMATENPRLLARY